MKVKTILLYTLASILLLVGVVWTIVFIAFLFTDENASIPKQTMPEKFGYFVAMTLFSTIGAIFLLCGWLIMRFIRKRKARLEKIFEMDSY